MTREEQIIEAAEKVTYQEPPQYSELVHKTRKVMSAYEVGFIDGCVWADQHPNWISVEDYEKDELPSLMDKEDQYGCSVSVLFVVNLDGVRYINKGCFDYDIGVWYSVDTGLIYTKEQVTHWMPIVPPRKEANNEYERTTKSNDFGHG